MKRRLKTQRTFPQSLRKLISSTGSENFSKKVIQCRKTQKIGFFAFLLENGHFLSLDWDFCVIKDKVCFHIFVEKMLKRFIIMSWNVVDTHTNVKVRKKVQKLITTVEVEENFAFVDF